MFSVVVTSPTMPDSRCKRWQPKVFSFKNVRPRAADTLLKPSQTHHLGNSVQSKLCWNEDASVLESTQFPVIIVNQDPSTERNCPPPPKKKLSDQSRLRTEILNLSDSERFFSTSGQSLKIVRLPNLKNFRHSNHCRKCRANFRFFLGNFSGLIFRNFGPVLDQTFGPRAKIVQGFAGLFGEL